MQMNARRRVVVFAVTVSLVNACARGAARAGGGATPMPVAERAVSRSAAARAPVMPAGVTPAMIARGDSLYSHNACQRCHGPFGVNGPNGPALAKGDTAKWLHSDGSYAGIVATILRGVPFDSLRNKTRRFQMNPRGSNPPLSDDDVKAVAAYLWKLNHP